ncbi:thiosulfate oxidation carrier complex protein SoxZ [Nitrincola sp. MINF-07-Sa-05]|uniref:thiosulfate oxidation carrier complex protein SoxZ n=1 Tax=Nitrincola salilacus TaxID=3400273 RepID=UPI003917D215
MSIFRVRAQSRGGKTNVRLLADHQMESGLRVDEQGNSIPANYLQEITVTHQGKKVFHVNMGPALTHNPYLAFSFNGGARGEELEISWKSNTGNAATESAKIE